LNIRRATIIEWLRQATYQDNRGWQKAKPRKYTDPAIAERIVALKRSRIEHNYFHGDDYIQMDYARYYPADELPTSWFIDQVVREHQLQTRKPKPGRVKGGSEYLLYPKTAIAHLGFIQQSADFIGKKYISERSEPINIFSTCYYRPFKLYQISRIDAEKALWAIKELQKQWHLYPVPHVLRLDNGVQFRGTASGKRALGLFVVFLLNQNVVPLFGSPSKPWTNPHVEGHNRVFNEKVWRKNFFTSVEHIDRECQRFNSESLELFQFKYASLTKRRRYRTLAQGDWNRSVDTLRTRKEKKIYFIRFVESPDSDHSAQIIVMNETVLLPERYNHQFVFVEWDLQREQLTLYSEHQGILTRVHQIPFKINE
jgi:hypothetical protein